MYVQVTPPPDNRPGDRKSLPAPPQRQQRSGGHHPVSKHRTPSCRNERRETMRRIFARIGFLMVAALALAGARPAYADAVTDWNAIMESTVAAPPTNPFFQARWSAIEQLAVFE